jgi:hypothetical protein
VALQKPNRDYALPHSYRLIQLLEVSGKALERVQARRLAFLAAKHQLFPNTQYGGLPGRSAQDALLSITHDIEAAWNHDKVVTMLTFDITGFFDCIPHAHLIDTMRKLHIPNPLVKWTHSFLSERRAAICLDGKRDELKPISTGVPQGSCVSPILAAYFTSPMSKAIAESVAKELSNDPELSAQHSKNLIKPHPLTLYVDDGSLAASAPSRAEATKVVQLAFKAAHGWLKKRGLKTDQVKNDLIHFTKSRTGRNAGPGPSITIPTNEEGTTRSVNPSKLIRYLGIWFDPQLKFTEHVKKAAAKATSAAHALRMLGNSERGIHQTHLRQMYLGAILPIALYGLPVFWRSKSGAILKKLTTLQNKCLRMITGAFRTTSINAMEIESSIPPVDIYLDYKLETEAIRLARLPDDHPLINRLYPNQRRNTTPTSPPPLPVFDPRKRYKSDPCKRFSTCITRFAKHILPGTERIRPLLESPWDNSGLDTMDRIVRARLRVGSVSSASPCDLSFHHFFPSLRFFNFYLIRSAAVGYDAA